MTDELEENIIQRGIHYSSIKNSVKIQDVDQDECFCNEGA